MWPFTKRYDTKERISGEEIRKLYQAYEPIAWLPLDGECLLWSLKDAQHFAWRYGIPYRPHISEIDDCDDRALDTHAAWRAGARKENLPRHPAYGVVWLRTAGSSRTHMMNDWILKEGLYRYEPATGEFRDMDSVERVFGRMG